MTHIRAITANSVSRPLKPDPDVPSDVPSDVLRLRSRVPGTPARETPNVPLRLCPWYDRLGPSLVVSLEIWSSQDHGGKSCSVRHCFSSGRSC